MSDELALLRGALEAMPDAFVLSRLDGTLVMQNRAFSELVGITPEQAASTQDRIAAFATLVKDRAALAKVIRQILADPTTPCEQELALADGRAIAFSIAPVRGAGGVIVGRLAVFRDVSAARARAQFLSNMSHELRTPLNAIVGFARVLVSPAVQMHATQRQYVQYIAEAGEHMTSLVDDLLDLRRVEEGRLPLELRDHPLDAIVEAARHMVRPLVVAREHRLEIELAATAARCDPRALVQVLINLLSNAAKYTEPGGSIRLTALAQADEVWLEVADTGAGIAPGDLAHLFNYFTQLGAKHEHHMHGSGVGLALTRELVAQMGGTVEVESELGRGSLFRVRLRAAAAG
jgi:PAS domain S-box-containing protein